jgi:energy-coupling factor transporter ATP-binding protein EcfA2
MVTPSVGEQQRRLAFIGPTGAGKTTAARLAQIVMPDVQVVSVSSLLRDIQGYVYTRVGYWLPESAGRQDQKLLVRIREGLDLIDPDLLQHDFERRVVEATHAAAVVNDDARLAIEPTLRKLQFVLVWVEGRHAHSRSDISRHVSANPQDTTIPRDLCDTEIINSGDIGTYAAAIQALLERGST